MIMGIDRYAYARRRSKLNLNGLDRPLTEEEMDLAERELAESNARFSHRKFVQDVRAGLCQVIAWDMGMTFEDYARRVDAGEFD